MKVEFECSGVIAGLDGDAAKHKVERYLSIFAEMLLCGSDETIYNVKIDGEDVVVY